MFTQHFSIPCSSKVSSILGVAIVSNAFSKSVKHKHNGIYGSGSIARGSIAR
jgi:hypothetical protein